MVRRLERIDTALLMGFCAGASDMPTSANPFADSEKDVALAWQIGRCRPAEAEAESERAEQEAREGGAG